MLRTSKAKTSQTTKHISSFILHPLNQSSKAKLQFFLCFPTYPFWFCSRIFAAFQSCKRHLVHAGKPSDSDLAVAAQHFGPAARAACRMTSQVAAHHPLETWRPWQVTAIQNGGSSLLGSKPVWRRRLKYGVKRSNSACWSYFPIFVFFFFGREKFVSSVFVAWGCGRTWRAGVGVVGHLGCTSRKDGCPVYPHGEV